MIKVRQLSIKYDTDYGIDKRSGWTSTINGHTQTQFVSLWESLFELITTILFDTWDED